MPMVPAETSSENYLRGTISEAEIQQIMQINREEQAVSDALAVKMLIVLAFVAVAALIALYRARGAIIKTADNALIEGSAAAVKGARAARQNWDKFKDRVLEKAKHS